MTKENACWILDMIKKRARTEAEKDALDMAIEALGKDSQPVKHGKWIKGELYIKCSECGYPVGHVSDNYCPNCGADMSGDTE